MIRALLTIIFTLATNFWSVMFLREIMIFEGLFIQLFILFSPLVHHFWITLSLLYSFICFIMGFLCLVLEFISSKFILLWLKLVYLQFLLFISLLFIIRQDFFIRFSLVGKWLVFSQNYPLVWMIRIYFEQKHQDKLLYARYYSLH